MELDADAVAAAAAAASALLSGGGPRPGALDSSSGGNGDTPSGRVLRKLRASLDEGDSYSALQMYKTQPARAKKKGDVEDALELARGGAVLLLERGEVISGAELARDYVEIAKAGAEAKEMTEATYEARVRDLVAMDDAFTRNSVTPEVVRERKRFLKAALEFSVAKGPWELGEPRLHDAAASNAISASEWNPAMKHLMQAQVPTKAAAVVVQGSRGASASELELRVTMFVLQFLALENLRDANLFFTACKTEAGARIDPHSPLMTFCALLLKTLERNAYPLFQQLRTKYRSELDRGARGGVNFDNYLDRIALVFYNVQPARTGFDMASMMKGLMGTS